MLDFNNLTRRKKQSSNEAKDRLKLVLIHDRMNCSTQLLEMMRADIIEVISKYVDIDQEEINIELSTLKCEEDGKKAPMLSANIPIKHMKRVK